MPRVIRRAKRTRKLTKAHLAQFADGLDFLGEAFGSDRAALREAWDDSREWYLARWVQEHPGTRPWAWWRFDATEPRRRYDGAMIPPKEGRLFGGTVESFRDALYEKQRHYLDRIGELTESERAYLLRLGRIGGDR